MIYKTINFTGLTVDGTKLFLNEPDIGESRFVRGVIPADYTRLVMAETKTVPETKKWIETNLTGRYSIYRMFGKTQMFFEEKSSAVLFKLLDGDKTE